MVPPAEHLINAAKHAIHTFKNHFIAILSTVDFNFPLTEWDRLFAQEVINFLHFYHLHPSLLVHAYNFGNFDYKHVPLAPPITKVAAHTSADKIHSFAPHGRLC